MNASDAMELYGTLFYVFMTVAILALILAVILFFVLDIPTVFALLTGRAKQKTIERIAKENQSGQHKKRDTNSQTLKQLEQTSGNLKKSMTEVLPISEDLTEETGLLTANEETSLLNETGETSVLNEAGETAVLNDGAETLLQQNDMPETSILKDSGMTPAFTEYGATEELKNPPAPSAVPVGRFEITESTILIHTNENIQ